METVIEYIGWFGNVVLVTVSIATALLWWRSRTTTSRLLAISFGVFTIGTLIGYLPWTTGETLLAASLAKFRFMLVIMFPWLLLRFADAFEPAPRWLLRVANVGIVLIALYIIPLPVNFGSVNVDTGAPMVAYAFNAIITWLLVVMPVAAWLLYRAGRGQPGVPRHRMHWLATAALLMFGAYLTAFLSPNYDTTAIRISSYVFVDASAIAFLIGFAPPATFRLHWRRPEEEALGEAIVDLMSATTPEEVLDAFLPKVARMIGATSAAHVRADGSVVGIDCTSPETARAMADQAASGDDGSTERHQLTTIRMGGDVVVLRTTAVTPLLGEEEFALLRWLSVIVELAIARCEHLAEDRAVVERLREVDRLKSEFVQIVAHDLRSPMAAVGGLASTLRTRWNDIDDATRAKLLDHIGASTDRMSDLIVDVLDVARIESGELSYDLAPFDLTELVKAAVEDQRRADELHSIELELMGGQLPMVVGDQRRTRQVVDNLLSNAMKFSPSNSAVEIRLAQDDGEVVVEVRDHGPGIKAADQQRIFEKFGRIQQDHGPEGTGLGLYICKAIVEAQGGRIWVESDDGDGATFSYTTPIAAEPS